MVSSTLVESLRFMVKKPYTRMVPVKSAPFKVIGLRGSHILDMNKCTGCSMCQQVCPATSIDMVTVEGNYPQNPRKRFPRIDHSKCTFCGLCVEYCPFNALTMTTATGYELFAVKKDKTLRMPTELRGDGGAPSFTKDRVLAAYSQAFLKTPERQEVVEK